VKKPITCAYCELIVSPQPCLHVRECRAFSTFHEFENFLIDGGPWLAAMDFPFGQPLKLLTESGWPLVWEEYVALVAEMGKAAFEEMIATYRMSRPAGDKLHLRVTDRLAGARSPMMLHYTPVGKMFFVGTSRLLSSGVSVLPCRPTNSERIVVEGYPALVARRWSGGRSYKSDERNRQTNEQMEVRQQILDSICSHELTAIYGMSLLIDEALLDVLKRDVMGDQLDAVLCAVQAAWACLQSEKQYGIPSGHEVEGWIVDPLLIGWVSRKKEKKV